jgi:uncharacterized protein DUF3592
MLNLPAMDENVWYGLLVLNAVALAFTAFLTWKTRRFLARAARAKGTIARVTLSESETMSYGADHPARTVRDYTPHVKFELPDGTPIEFESRVSHPSSPLYQTGQTVSVVYDRANPAATAEIAGPAVWQKVVFASIGACVLLIATLGMKACS